MHIGASPLESQLSVSVSAILSVRLLSSIFYINTRCVARYYCSVLFKPTEYRCHYSSVRQRHYCHVETRYLFTCACSVYRLSVFAVVTSRSYLINCSYVFLYSQYPDYSMRYTHVCITYAVGCKVPDVYHRSTGHITTDMYCQLMRCLEVVLCEIVIFGRKAFLVWILLVMTSIVKNLGWLYNVASIESKHDRKAMHYHSDTIPVLLFRGQMWFAWWWSYPFVFACDKICSITMWLLNQLARCRSSRTEYECNHHLSSRVSTEINHKLHGSASCNKDDIPLLWEHAFFKPL